MLKKMMSIVIVFASVFSLIQMMPARAEEYVEEKTNKNENQIEELVESKLTGGLNAPKPSEEEWKRVMEEQEKLMTPEIRASIRENVLKNLEKQNLKNKDFVMKNSKPSDFGFKTQAEYQKWLEEPFVPMKSLSSGTLSLNYTEYALKVGSSLTLEASGYSNATLLHWMYSDKNLFNLTFSPNGNAHQVRVKAVQPGTGWVSVHDYGQDPVAATGCTFESISLTLNSTYVFLKTGESFTVTATTSHSDSRIALRTDSDGVFAINGNTFTVLDNPTTSMTNIYAYLVDRPTVVECICVEITNYGQQTQTISASVSSTTCHCGDSVTVSATTNPPNAEVVWSVEPANGGYFKGNAFYPQRTGFVTLRATIAGTNIYSEKSVYVPPRFIRLSENRVTKKLGQGGFPIDISISHGSLYDLTYDIDHPEVVEITYIAGYPYVILKQTGSATIIIDAPGSADNVMLFIDVINSLSFSSAPAALYSSYTYTFEIYTTASEKDLAVLTTEDLDSTTTTRIGFEAVENSPNKYRFDITAGNEGEHFYVVAFEGATMTEISKEYTVLPKSQAPDVAIVNETNLVQTVYNENVDNSGKLKVEFSTYMTINGDKQDNEKINYRITKKDGINCTLTGNVLTITPEKVDYDLEGLETVYKAHKTGTIEIEASLEKDLSKRLIYTVIVDCENRFVPGAIGNNCIYQLIPNNDISGFSKGGDFIKAFKAIGMNANGGTGNVVRQPGVSAQMVLFDTIRNTKVFAIHSHGSPGSLLINCDNNTRMSYNDVTALHKGYFASTNLILSLTCHAEDSIESTGSGDSSILSAFREKGVKCTIGFGGEVYSLDAQKFEEAFYNEILTHGGNRSIRSVYDAVAAAKDVSKTYGAQFAGDRYTRFDS